ncbi:MAG: hypothetical protein JWN99_1248 [Ilumatobacteraceae bacterium]|nr:hypothetical protein [Ilumatobacteraceae bacterium]
MALNSGSRVVSTQPPERTVPWGRRVGSLLALTLVVTGLAVAGPLGAAQPAVAAAPAAAKFVSVSPTRILDTRLGLGAPAGVVPGGRSIDVQVTGFGGVPAGATAVAFNLTATDAVAAGFVTAWPTGSDRPTVSNINLQAAGATVANLVVVALPASGQVSLFTQTGASFIADVAGYWIAAAGGNSTDGRFAAQSPTRILDTRLGLGAPAGLRGAGQTVTFPVAGQPGVPATGISAAVLVVTATDAVAGGFITAWPSGTAQPTASVLNLKAAADTVPNLVIVPLGADGQVSLFTQSGANLVVDVVGTFTNTTSASSSSGLFVPLAPERFLDSRSHTPFGKLWPGQRNDLVVGGQHAVPATGVSAVVANLTSTEATDPGFVTAWPAVTAQPVASNLNAPGGGGTVASLAFVALGSTKAFSLFSQAGTDIIADVAGYFLGTPLPADPAVPVTPPPPPTPALVSRPNVGTTAFPCANGPSMDQIKRVDVNPGLITYLQNLAPYSTGDALQSLAYTFMVNSGPLPARVALDPEFSFWIDVGTFGPVTEPNQLMDLLNLAYHETIHSLQAGRCALTGPTTGYPTPRIGFLQSELFDDVNARIDAIQPMSAQDDSYAHSVAQTYLQPGSDVGDQGFESQMWEINAYVLSAEWGAAVNDTFGVDFIGDTAGNDDTMSAKFHQLARYLNRAQTNPALWAQLQASPGLVRAVTDQWNLGVKSWQVYKQPLRKPTLYWDLAFGPDVAPIAAFTNNAAGTVAPPRPAATNFSSTHLAPNRRLLTADAASHSTSSATVHTASAPKTAAPM